LPCQKITSNSEPSSTSFPKRFRDPFGRDVPHVGDIDPHKDYVLNPKDGKLKPLIVQRGTICVSDRRRAWTEASLENKTSWLLRAVYFVFDPVPEIVAPTSSDDIERRATEKAAATPGQPGPDQNAPHQSAPRWQFWNNKKFRTVCNVAGRWLLCCIAMFFLVLPSPRFFCICECSGLRLTGSTVIKSQVGRRQNSKRGFL
jgi:hypothetical protein